MKRGDVIEGVIGGISFPNKGSFVYDGKPVTVKGVLPGEKVTVRIKRNRKDRAEATLIKKTGRSPLETKKPMCNHFYECGGCTYQTVAYTNQLRLKEQMVKDVLAPVIDMDGGFEWEGIKSSPEQYRYRNKMEFTFGDAEKDGPLTLGLHRQHSSYDVISVDSCMIIDPAINEILKFTQKYFRERGVPFYHKMTHTGILRNLVIRESAYDGSIMVNLVTTTSEDINKYEGKPAAWWEKRNEVLGELDLPGYAAGLLGLGDGTGRFDSLSHYSRISGILYTECDTFADAVIPDSVTTLYGDDFLMEEVLGLKFRISPFSFFQTNTKGSEVLYSKAREYAKEAIARTKTGDTGRVGTIFDLYSGTGTIAQLMSDAAENVYGIEIISEAVEAAAQNAKLNGLGNCHFIAGDVLAKLDEIKERPDLIILDPPREGVNPKALRKIIDYGVESIVYISCKPTSLAKDLEMLIESGYAPVKGCCVDMFPNTQHVETVVLMSKKTT